MDFDKLFYLFLILIFFQMFYFQLRKLNIKDPSSCLGVFKSNNFLGLIVFVGLFLGKI